MPRHRVRTPSLPADIKARQEQQAEQARQAHQRTVDSLRDRDRLVAAGNLVEDLGRDFELERRTDRLPQWVAAMAGYGSLLAERGMLERLAQPPAGIPEHDRDAWQTAVDVFRAADTDLDRSAAALAEVAGLPDFAVSVARWLRRGIRQVCEGYGHDSLTIQPAAPSAEPGDTEVAVPDPLDIAREAVALARAAVETSASKSMVPAGPWEGDDSWENLMQQTRRVLRHMHGREQDNVANFVEVVWETSDENVTNGAIYTAISRANHFLRKQNHPRHLEKVRGEPIVRWV